MYTKQAGTFETSSNATDQEFKIGFEHSLRLYIAGRSCLRWEPLPRLSVPFGRQDLATEPGTRYGTFFLSLYQAAQTNRHHCNHLVMAHTPLGFPGLFVLAPELSSVSFLSGFRSVGLSDLQAFKCEDLFSCVKMAQGKFLH